MFALIIAALAQPALAQDTLVLDVDGVVVEVGDIAGLDGWQELFEPTLSTSRTPYQEPDPYGPLLDALDVAHDNLLKSGDRRAAAWVDFVSGEAEDKGHDVKVDVEIATTTNEVMEIDFAIDDILVAAWRE